MEVCLSYRRKVYDNVFLATAVLGALFIITEIIFQSFGKSICQTKGCEIVSQHSRFGDISILLIGLVTFSLLALLSFLALYRNRVSCNKYITLILVVSLAAEGFFVGYQAFRLQTLCVICAITFGFFLVLGIMRLLSGDKEVIAGFLSSAAVVSLFYLILPAGGAVRLPEEELVLFYSVDCRYCSEVREKIDAHKIQVSHLLVGEYSGLLKNIGIEHVPTLLVNKKNQKIFLTGREAIDQYLFVDSLGQSQKDSTQSTAVQTKKKPLPAARPRSQLPGMLFLPQGSSSKFLIQPADVGMCIEGRAEEKKCD